MRVNLTGSPIVVEAVQLGSTASASDEEFVALFHEYLPVVRQVARRIVGDEFLAEDVAAESFTRLYIRWTWMRRHPQPHAWLCRVATNLAIDRVRRQSPVVAPPPPEADPYEAIATRLALAAALGALPRRQRQIVALRFLADISVEDVATTLGISSGAVKSHCHRALESLRRAMPGSRRTTSAFDWS
ncbi:MAG: sigma-70 family RNA polymerase sigma factor [Actinomycetota bacterium]